MGIEETNSSVVLIELNEATCNTLHFVSNYLIFYRCILAHVYIHVYYFLLTRRNDRTRYTIHSFDIPTSQVPYELKVFTEEQGRV